MTKIAKKKFLQKIISQLYHNARKARSQLEGLEHQVTFRWDEKASSLNMVEKLRACWANICAPLVPLLQEVNIASAIASPKATTTTTEPVNQPKESKSREPSEEEPHMTVEEEDVARLVIQLSGRAKVFGQGETFGYGGKKDL